MTVPRFPLSRWTAIFIWAVIVISVAWPRPTNSFTWDSFGYHLYLPAAFIHHDLHLKDLSWVEEAKRTSDDPSALYQVTIFEDGSRVVKYSMGLAVLWAPWFLVGHAVAATIHAPMDGYSAPYQIAVVIGVLVYVLIGFFWLRRVLLSAFSDRVTSAVLLLIVFGTNYLEQAVFGLMMPHVVLFSLYAGILRFTIRWQASRAWGDAVRLGMLMGFAVLCRPSEAVCVLIPALCGLAHVREWRAHWATLRMYWKQWALIGAILFAIGLPQFLYWKSATGHFFVDSYNSADEGFDLLTPHTIELLFSFRKGWYIYSPLMAVATIGFFALRRKWRAAFLASFVFFLINLYVVSSWTCWWYANSFSSRALIGSYAIMALPLGSGLSWAEGRKGLWRWAVIGVCIAFTMLNVFQIWQMHRGIIHPSRMTRTAWLAGFGRTTRPEHFDALLSVVHAEPVLDKEPDTARYRTVQVDESLLILPPAPELDTLVFDTRTGNARRMFRLGKGHSFTPGIHLGFRSLTHTDHAYVTAEWHVWIPSGSIPSSSVVMTMEHGSSNYGYRGYDLQKMEVHPGWNTIRTRYLTPELHSTGDLFVTYFWSQDTARILVSPPALTIHEPLTEL